jgi:hypothetical protein
VAFPSVSDEELTVTPKDVTMESRVDRLALLSVLLGKMLPASGRERPVRDVTPGWWRR